MTHGVRWGMLLVGLCVALASPRAALPARHERYPGLKDVTEQMCTTGQLALEIATAAGPTGPSCQANPNLVGRCVLVHGRLRAYNGNPTFRIWPVGSMRLLGVTGAQPGQAPIMPHDLGASFDRDVYADFTVCPFTRQRPGVMQRVCIEGATNRIGMLPRGHETTGR